MNDNFGTKNVIIGVIITVTIALILVDVNTAFGDEGMYMLLEQLLIGNWKFISPMTENYYPNPGSLTISSINHDTGRLLGQLDSLKTGKINISGCLSEGGGVFSFSMIHKPCTPVDKHPDRVDSPQTKNRKGTKDKATQNAYEIMKKYDNPVNFKPDIAIPDQGYQFKGYIFYNICNGQDSTFFGGQLVIDLPCNPDLAGYVLSSSGEDYGWRAFR